jgi:hypothetical protein
LAVILLPGVAAGVLGGAAAAAGQAEDAQVRLGEVQAAAPADGQQVSVLRSCHQLLLSVVVAIDHEITFLTLRFFLNEKKMILYKFLMN